MPDAPSASEASTLTRHFGCRGLKDSKCFSQCFLEITCVDGYCPDAKKEIKKILSSDFLIKEKYFDCLCNLSSVD